MKNCPNVRHRYVDKKLWIFGVGNCYSTKKESEKYRDKKYERPAKFHFFGADFYANVARYDYWKTIESVG